MDALRRKQLFENREILTMRYLIVLPAMLAAIFLSGCYSTNCGGNACSNSHYQCNCEHANPPSAPPPVESHELTQPEPIAAPQEDMDMSGYVENVQPAVLPPVEPPMPGPETEVPMRPTPTTKMVPPNPPTNLVPPANEIPSAAPPTNQLPTVLDSI